MEQVWYGFVRHFIAGYAKALNLLPFPMLNSTYIQARADRCEIHAYWHTRMRMREVWSINTARVLAKSHAKRYYVVQRTQIIKQRKIRCLHYSCILAFLVSSTSCISIDGVVRRNNLKFLNFWLSFRKRAIRFLSFYRAHHAPNNFVICILSPIAPIPSGLHVVETK